DWLFFDYFSQQSRHTFRLERRTTRQQLVKDGAEAIDIAPNRRLPGVARRHFGRDIVRRAQEICGWGQLAFGADQLGQTEVTDVCTVLVIKKNIARFEVPMEDPMRVSKLDGISQ